MFFCALTFTTPIWAATITGSSGNAVTAHHDIQSIAVYTVLAQTQPAPVQTQPTPAQTQPTPAQTQPTPAQTQSKLKKIESDLQKLQTQMLGRDQAEKTIVTYLGFIAIIIAIVSVVGIFLQIWSFRIDRGTQRRNQEEYEKQRVKENEINSRFLQVLNVSSNAAEKAQRKVENLEEGGIKRAADTLQLINSLLTITERAAAKAAGAQYEFLSRSIDTFDKQCKELIVEATKDDERDIIAKPEFIERVNVLSQQIVGLDNQILFYNESVPPQLIATEEVGEADLRPYGGMAAWNRLELTGPCLFIRGLSHHLEQHFNEAMVAWKSSLSANGSKSVEVYSNYWIGYVSNTLGDFDNATVFLKAAASIAPPQKEVELRRLALETRFFSLDLDEVPTDIVKEGTEYYDTLAPHQVSPRSMSSFATTMGNICMIQNLRAAARGAAKVSLEQSNEWFEKALAIEDRTRWARLGLYTNQYLEKGELDAHGKEEVLDVMASLGREYSNRIEHRSKVLSKVTEYICMLMLDRKEDQQMSTIVGQVQSHASEVQARTIYSQFRKQNVSKDTFSDEFRVLQDTGNLEEAIRFANTRKEKKRL